MARYARGEGQGLRHEVWIWRRGKLTAHVLRDGTYTETPESAVLLGLNLDELAAYLDRPTSSRAIREYRDFIRAKRNR